MREIVNANFYVMRGGIACRLLPLDFLPWGTVYRGLATWRDDGVFERINHAPVIADRERVGREASRSAAIIPGLNPGTSQSVKTKEAGGPRDGACPRASLRSDPGNAGKKINGRKRHALVDTDGRALVAVPLPTNIQNRDGGGPLLEASRPIFPFIERVFAHAAHDHERVTAATTVAVEIVRKLPDQLGFIVLARRWVVERFFAWIGRNRRLAKSLPRRRPGTSRRPLRLHAASSTPPLSCCSFAASPKLHEFRNRLSVIPASPAPEPLSGYRITRRGTEPGDFSEVS